MTETERLHRRNLMNNARSIITATNDAGGVHRVQVKPSPVEIIDDVPVVQLYGISSHAPVGSEAHMICTRGDRSSAVVVATNTPAARPRNLKSGEVALYTAEGDTIVLKNGHVIAISTTGTVAVSAPIVNIAGQGNGTTVVNVTGDVHCTGNVSTGAAGGNNTVTITGDIHCTGTITADTIYAPKGHVGP